MELNKNHTITFYYDFTPTEHIFCKTQIEKLVNQLYVLTEEEIAIIENSTK